MQLIQPVPLFVLYLGIFRINAIFNECQTKSDCGLCISSNPKCAWCKDIYYNSTVDSYYRKCDFLEHHDRQQCGSISNPPSSNTIDKAADLVGETRVSPQEISVKLRPGQITTLDVKVKTPKNFPIDLYYLMDLSYSMRDDLKQIKTLGEKLRQEMKNITTNFRLGFGGFVDKPLGPYAQTSQAEIRSKIQEANGDLQYTFGYKNYLPLDENPSRFAETIDSVKISFNVDGPEGSLEALMQVVACTNDIKWRGKQKARRIVIVTTDALFHYSGDGLLGGVITPNDGACHLVDGNYTGWNKFDYPSLSHIRSAMFENAIVPIFATTGNSDLYKKVAEFFGEGSGAVADRLNKDSSNVVPLIKEAYEKIAKLVKIGTSKDLPDGISVKYATKCGQDVPLPEAKKEAFCNNIAIGEEVTFQVEMEAKDCTQKDKQNLQFKIETNFDDILVNVELLCDCNCNDTVVNSTHCTSRGNLSCGMCFCDPTLFGGRFCQCTLEEARNQSLCGSERPVCSGKGFCDCGDCRCEQPPPKKNGEIEYIYGKYCECSNMTCGRSNKLVCGGPDHGTCDCGTCTCDPSWQGDTCADECPKGTDQCEDSQGVTCNGRGTCACNRCRCDAGYVGDLCQECVSNCPDPCQDYRECVRCLVLETSDLSPSECNVECAKWNITTFETVKKVPEDRRCIARDEDDCSFVFTFDKNNITEEVRLIVQEDRICPAEPDILAIILGVIAGIVGIGLALLLIWKLLATIQDRREFAKFEKDRQNPKWDSGENPIYQKATSTFQNPMYGNQPEPEPQM